MVDISTCEQYRSPNPPSRWVALRFRTAVPLHCGSLRSIKVGGTEVPPLRFPRGNLELNNPICESLVAELARRKIFVDPTLAVFRNMILLPDVPEVHDHPDNALVPRRLQDFWPLYLKQTGCPQGGPLMDRRREFARYQELTGKLYRAGVPLLVGTDSPEPQVPPGFSLRQELEMLVESGMTPADVLTAATLTNATVLRERERPGSITPGKIGDMILLTDNPLEDIRHTRSIEFVIHNGLVCQPSELLKRVPVD